MVVDLLLGMGVYQSVQPVFSGLRPWPFFTNDTRALGAEDGRLPVVEAMKTLGPWTLACLFHWKFECLRLCIWMAAYLWYLCKMCSLPLVVPNCTLNDPEIFAHTYPNFESQSGRIDPAAITHGNWTSSVHGGLNGNIVLERWDFPLSCLVARGSTVCVLIPTPSWDTPKFKWMITIQQCRNAGKCWEMLHINQC